MIAPVLLADTAVCADPKWLEVVDAAFKRLGGPAGKILADHACGVCPVRTACLTFALENNEHGPWGGLSDYQRTLMRGQRVSYTHNTAGIHKAAS